MARRKSSTAPIVGESIDREAAGFVRLPSGMVLTHGGTYTPTEAGVHVFFDADAEDLEGSEVEVGE